MVLFTYGYSSIHCIRGVASDKTMGNTWKFIVQNLHYLQD